MRLPRVRFTVRRMMIVVALCIEIIAIGAKLQDACPATVNAVIATGVVGLLALRMPFVAFPSILLTRQMIPAHEGYDAQLLFLGVTLAWVVCAPMGWVHNHKRALGRKAAHQAVGPLLSG